MNLNAWLGLETGQLATALFIFARLTALLSVAPLVSSKSVPNPVRLGLAGLMALILAPLLRPSPVSGLPALLVGLAKELIVGLALGWTAEMFFSCAQMAGEWLDLQSGFQASQLLNPDFDTQNAVLGTFNYLVAGLVFLGTGGYAIVLRAAIRSFGVSPPGALRLCLGTAPDWTALVGQVIWIALQLAAPVAAALFLAEIAIGFITRAMSRVNVMTLTLPAKSGLALAAIALSVPVIAHALGNAFGRMALGLGAIVQGMGS